MKTTTQSRPAAQLPSAPRIESDTPIVPRAVMVAVCEAASVWLGHPLPRRWVRELTARANTVYAHNPRFRRKVRAEGNSGRDYLWAFVRHWLAGLILERRPDFHALLPASYNCGHPLPQEPFVASRRLKAARRVPPPTRLRTRPTPGHAFAAAAHFHLP